VLPPTLPRSDGEQTAEDKEKSTPTLAQFFSGLNRAGCLHGKNNRAGGGRRASWKRKTTPRTKRTKLNNAAADRRSEPA